MVRFVFMFLASGFFHGACASDRLVELESPVTLSVDSSNQRSAESVLLTFYQPAEVRNNNAFARPRASFNSSMFDICPCGASE